MSGKSMQFSEKYMNKSWLYIVRSFDFHCNFIFDIKSVTK